MNPDDVTSPTCTVCHCGLYDTELARQACTPCERRTDENLAALPGPDGLYARLSASLHPGSGSGGPAVSGSRSAPIPVRLAPLSLAARGGLVTILQTWLIDWHEQLDYRHPRWDGDLQQQCDQVVKRLRILLPWAAERHGAFDEFARELANLKHQAEAATGGERPPRRFGVTCGCGATLKITIESPAARCDTCLTQYDRQGLFDLPLAERRAA
ncbi:hypothetical protein [Streptomyces scabiei]|uniref:hypothetical protein n=1 Tax=Streptomyces scabiei TaxID=1930 RepID=UPI0029A718EA|nr:hypothetical protein [Streptomyces scabiei]MDX3027521.1 hypothetical protein [Streptomyces scabiei]